MTKVKKPFFTENEKCYSWRIHHRCGEKFAQKKNNTFTMATIWKNKPDRLIFNKFVYDKSGIEKKKTFVFKISGDKVNILSLNGNRWRTKTSTFNTSHTVDNDQYISIPTVLRFQKCVNFFYRLNKYPNRLKLPALRKEKIKSGTPASILDEGILKSIYPSISYFTHNSTISKIDFIRPILKKKLNFRELVFAVAGNKGKKTRALFQSKPHITMAQHFLIWKNLVPLENIQKLAENSYGYYRSGIQIRKFIRSQSAAKRLSLIEDFNKVANYYIEDTAKMFLRLGKPNIPQDIKKWREIHNHLMRLERRIKTENETIKYSEKIDKINNTVIDDLRIEFPPDTHTLTDYSEILNNCISGYGNRAVKGNCVLMGIYKNNILTYNVELSERKVRQFVGKHNGLPDQKDKDKILKFLEKEKIIDEIGNNRFAGIY